MSFWVIKESEAISRVQVFIKVASDEIFDQSVNLGKKNKLPISYAFVALLQIY